MLESSKKPAEDLRRDEIDELIVQSFAKLDPIALGVAVGVLCGAAIFLLTNALVLKNDSEALAELSLLGQFFVGFRPDLTGSLIGLFYGSIFGFLLGSTVAFVRNVTVTVYMSVLQMKNEEVPINDVIDNS